jgi:hypothetical protein
VLEVHYFDFDGDGSGVDAQTMMFCPALAPAGWVRTAGDCDDRDAEVSPDEAESCATGSRPGRAGTIRLRR